MTSSLLSIQENERLVDLLGRRCVVSEMILNINQSMLKELLATEIMSKINMSNL